jgi:hypothetical protein
MIVAALLLVIGIGVFFIVRQSAQVRELNELTEQLNYDKELLTEEYSDFAVQFEGADFRVGNDSLLQLLDAEKQKVRSLLAELKAVKATNLTRIRQLQDELTSVRKVMMHYVMQIDSLNALNQRLTTENTQIRRQYNEASQTVTSLTREKQTLNERISLAAMLEAKNIAVRTLNDKGKATSKLNRIQNLEFCFQIGKNITAAVGEKTVYIRILRPDNNVMVKNANNIFGFENKDIHYSAKRTVEYGGEDLPVCLYWEVTEALFAGEYRVDIFTDGNLIGQKRFTIK